MYFPLKSLKMLKENNRYEILESLPTYGPMYIPVSGNDEPFYSEGFAVRFYKTDKTKWVANFQPGWTDLKVIFELNENTNLLVVASGTCYLMNPDQTKPISVFGVGYSTAFKTLGGRIILIDQINLTIVEPNGSHWETERISWDGLEELKFDENIVIGLAYNPMYDAYEWVKFSYNIDTKELIGGSYPKPSNPQKSKWQFW